MPPNKRPSKTTIRKYPRLPVGVGFVPTWWMEATPHHKLDLEAHQAQKRSQEQLSHYYLKLAALGLVGSDGYLVTGPGGQPDWSRIQDQRIQINPKLFGIAEADPDFNKYTNGEMLPAEFKSKMQEIYGGVTPNQMEYRKYGATKDDFQPVWAKNILKKSDNGEKIRSGVDIEEGPNAYHRRFGGMLPPGLRSPETPRAPPVAAAAAAAAARQQPGAETKLVRKVRRVKKNGKGAVSGETTASASSAPTTRSEQPPLQSKQKPRSMSSAPLRISQNSKQSQSSQRSSTGNPRHPSGPKKPNRERGEQPRKGSVPHNNEKQLVPKPKSTSNPRSPKQSHKATSATSSAHSIQDVSTSMATPSKDDSEQTPLATDSQHQDDAYSNQTPLLSNSLKSKLPQQVASSLVHSPEQQRTKSWILPDSHQKAAEHPVIPPKEENWMDVRAKLKETLIPTVSPTTGVEPSWRQTYEKPSFNYHRTTPIAMHSADVVESSPSRAGATHKLVLLDEDEEDSTAEGEEEVEEVEEYYEDEHYEDYPPEEFYEVEEEILIDEITLEEGGSEYYEEETLHSGEVEYYDEEYEEYDDSDDQGIGELQARLASKQAELARLQA